MPWMVADHLAGPKEIKKKMGAPKEAVCAQAGSWPPEMTSLLLCSDTNVIKPVR